MDASVTFQLIPQKFASSYAVAADYSCAVAGYKPNAKKNAGAILAKQQEAYFNNGKSLKPVSVNPDGPVRYVDSFWSLSRIIRAKTTGEIMIVVDQNEFCEADKVQSEEPKAEVPAPEPMVTPAPASASASASAPVPSAVPSAGASSTPSAAPTSRPATKPIQKPTPKPGGTGLVQVEP